jgi:hypothetical protein
MIVFVSVDLLMSIPSYLETYLIGLIVCDKIYATLLTPF